MRPPSRSLLAGAVAATAAYLFTRLAFTGSLDLVHLAVFVAFFVPVQLGFWWFVGWAERLEN